MTQPNPTSMLDAAQVDDLERTVAQSIPARPSAESQDTVVGYVPGGWDMFHIGHLNILKASKQLCDRLIVGVATDESLFRSKGVRPIVGLAERMQIVAALRLVDAVVVDQGSKIEVHSRHPFDVLFKGDDWLGTPKGDQLVADMASVGVRVHFLGYTRSTSSTMLRKVLTAL